MQEKTSSPEGHLEAIWLKPARRVPMSPVERVPAEAGRGLEGNADQGGQRQVTILSAEAWEKASAELGVEVDPRVRRANLYLRGLDLSESRGRVLELGDCRILIRGETRPCRLLEDHQPGLVRALAKEWRAGAHGEVLEGGELEVGMTVRWSAEIAAAMEEDS